jgi:hypothetical protein
MMLKLITLLVFFVLTLQGQEHVMDLGTRGKLTLYLLGDWKATVINMAGQYEVTFTPRSDAVNASGSFKISFPEVDRLDTKARLKQRVEVDGAPFASQSVEGKAYAQEFSVGTGYGYYCNFTDAALRGKRAPPGEFKVVSAGKVRVTPEIVVDIFLGADAFRDAAYQQLLGAIEGMVFTPGRGR